MLYDCQCPSGGRFLLRLPVPTRYARMFILVAPRVICPRPPTPFKNPHIDHRHHAHSDMTREVDAGRAVGSLFVGSGVDTDITGPIFLQTCEQHSQ